MRKAWKVDLGPGRCAGRSQSPHGRGSANGRPICPGRACSEPRPSSNALLEKQIKVDQAVANGSAIAFLAELGSKSCLFLADAHHEVITRCVERL